MSGSVSSKHAYPPSTFVRHLSSCQSQQWGIFREPLPRGKAFISTLLEAVNIVLLHLIFHLKYAYVDSYSIFLQRIILIAKICVFFSLHTTLPTVFLHLPKKSLPAVTNHLAHGGQTINVSFEEFK